MVEVHEEGAFNSMKKDGIFRSIVAVVFSLLLLLIIIGIIQ